MWQLQPLPPLKRVTPLFYSNSPLKGEVLSIPPPFWKFGWRLNSPPPLGGKGGVHTMCYIPKSTYKNVLVLPSWHLVHPAAENDFDTLKQLVGFANELYVFNHFVGLALKGLSLEVTKIT